jgi:L-iditol 2-dehydrogenase
MAERFAVPAANLVDTIAVDDLRPEDAALIEPLACVAKSLRLAAPREQDRLAVIGLGVMGLMHLLAFRAGAGCDTNPRRLAWARAIGLDARSPEAMEPAEIVVVCPGSEAALRAGLALAAPGARVILFAPMPPGADAAVPLHDVYFRDLCLISAYSCGPDDTRRAAEWIREGRVRAEQVVSDLVTLEGLPRAYEAMRSGDILKAMVLFG